MPIYNTFIKNSQRNPLVEYYISRLSTAGATLTETEQNALNDFANGIDADGTRNKIIRFCGFFGGVAGINIPIINGPTNGVPEGDANDTIIGSYNSSFIYPDGILGGYYQPTPMLRAGNLRGDMFPPQTMGHGFIGRMVRPFSNGVVNMPYGIQDNIGQRWVLSQIRGLADNNATNQYCQWNVDKPSEFVGYALVNSISASEMRFYANGVEVTSAIGGNRTTLPLNYDLRILGWVTTNGAVNYSVDGVIAGVWFTREASHAQALSIANRIQTLMRAVGRKV